MIDKTAIIENTAEISDGVSIGPYAVIRGKVKIGRNTTIDAHAVIEGNTVIGEDNYIGIGTIIGNPPQDLKYSGEETGVVMGNSNTIREYVTINRGTAHRLKTEIGSNNMLMSYVHVAHDCLIRNDTVIANCATLAGHVTVEAGAIIGGLTPIHQFARIGKLAIIGGGSRVPQDVVPFCKAAGNPIKLYGLNTIGLKRNDFSESSKKALKETYRIIFRQGLATDKAIEKIKSSELMKSEHVARIVKFIETSERGITR